ncbi:MAG: hypothetical protein AAGE03_11210 [Pseudomonadota bacterium]
MRLFLVLAAGMSLTGCGIIQPITSGLTGISSPFLGPGAGTRRGVAEVQGVRFRTRVTATSDDRRNFLTSTPGAARAPVAASEAGRTQAITYCLRLFGGSQIQWTVGPDVEPEQIALDDAGTLVMSGRCVVR